MRGILEGGEGRGVVGGMAPLVGVGGHLDHVAGEYLRCIEDDPLLATV